jgi:hypothetical protein
MTIPFQRPSLSETRLCLIVRKARELMMASNSNPALHVSHTTRTSHPGLGRLCLRLAHPLLPSLDASRRTSPEDGERRTKGCERASSQVDVEEWATEAHLAVRVHDMDSGYEGYECLIYLCVSNIYAFGKS